MAITRINVGTLANDGTGDDLRQAFVKVNNNFDDLDTRVQSQATATNLGSGEGLFYSKENGVLGFKSLVAGDNVTLTSDANTITIGNPGTINLQGTSGTGAIAGANRTLIVQGGQNINTTVLSNTITVAVDSNGLVQSDTNPSLGGNLNGQTNNITNVSQIEANSISGALTGTVDGIDVTEMYNGLRNVRGFDLGGITVDVTKGLDYLVATSSIDYGSVTAPASIDSNYGSIV